MLTKQEKEIVLKSQDNLNELDQNLKLKLVESIKKGESPFELAAPDEICCYTGMDVPNMYIRCSSDTCTSLGYQIVDGSNCH